MSTIARVVIATALRALIGLQLSFGGIWLLVELSALLGVYGLFLALLRELDWQHLRPFALWQKKPS
jgi:hypothetical protein